MSDQLDAERIIENAAQQGVRFCNLEFTDIVGMAKAVTLPLEQIRVSLTEGRWFDGSSLQGFARVTESDMYLQPDMTTFTIIPWEKTRARVVCDVLRPDGEIFDGDPRGRLRQMISIAEQHGFRYEVAPEVEFFLLRNAPDDRSINVHPFDHSSYFDLIGESVTPFWQELLAMLEDMHVPVESSHHEAADGQYEIDLALLDALKAADAILSAKLAIKSIAAKHGLYATFLPKPIKEANGSGMHLHQRLVQIADGSNTFCQTGIIENIEDIEYGLSQTGLYFIAGLLEHAKGMSAILSPLVNSYKRLVPNFEAPVGINWGHHNQDVMVRVPRLNSRKANDLRIEIRSPDPSCNPYLALTILLAAGLDGIERKVDCPPAIREIKKRQSTSGRTDSRRYRLPESLADALEAMENDSLLYNALGSAIYDEFLEAKWQEWDDYRTEVSQWELQRYLAIF